jgi:S-adenosylmethionine/arginine decarboxylase-like enzyme
MEEMYDFLEGMVKRIGMTPIIRANVVKNKIENPTFLSGMIMIAESHISLHYDIKNNIIYADIFSCMPFDYNCVTKIYEILGKVTSYEVVPRGTKHYTIINNFKEDVEKVASEKWKKNIYN